MLFIQLTGLSGAGKSTIAAGVKEKLKALGIKAEIIDADIVRPILCRDLGFSKQDRQENIRRLGFVCNLLATNGIVVILAAINPFEEIRGELKAYGNYVKTVWVNCELDILIKRDTKKLYKRAFLPKEHPDKITNLTGVNDPYDIPFHVDLLINTGTEDEATSIDKLFGFIIKEIS